MTGADGRAVPVVAMGASAGGVTALTQLVASLPADLPAAVMVVLHITATGPSLLPEILTRAGDLPARHATDGDAIEACRIYVAPPDQHLLVDGATVRVTRSPRENGVRPSVDLLFRSVARGRGSRSVAVVLSGMLDDGTAGLAAVGERGGRTIVQDPDDAIFPSMPENAKRYAAPEFVVPVSEMGALIASLVAELPPFGEGDIVDGVAVKERADLSNEGTR